MLRKLLFSAILIAGLNSTAQNTIGTTFVNANVFEAYTLFSINTNTYLINNCGERINEWNSTYLPGAAVYLLPNGNLLRAGRSVGTSMIGFGGVGGIIELFNWEGDLIWSFEYSTEEYRQHHDIYPLPNGNILILAATVMTEAEAIEAGRDPVFLTETQLYNEQIIEVEPVGTDQANIVWEWNIMDHVIQDFDNTKSNFGDVALSPEKLDINFLNGGNGGANWLHFNSIQYDETLDQIVISSRNLSEIFIIDHSTTTAEAATGSGGDYGKGGDILYRWGNPQSYRQGTEMDRILYGQHYPHYIPEGLNDSGKIIVFNNGNGRTPLFSEVLIFNPPTSAPGVYEYTSNTTYGPLAADYSYSDQSSSPSEFFSAIVSSAQRLANGNTLICEGRTGEIFEIDDQENIVWEYRNPVSNADGTLYSQFDSFPVNNILFRAIKYAPDFGAFDGRDLTPGLPLELNPNLAPCENLNVEQFEFATVDIYPNPTSDVINILSQDSIDNVEFYSVLGKKVMTSSNLNSIDISAFKAGIYFVQLYSGNQTITKKIIKK